MARVKKSKNKNFFVRFWNGELSLPMSYWGVGIGIGILFGFIIVVFIIAAGLSDDAMWGFIIPFQIYTVVGIWRSANRFKVLGSLSKNCGRIWCHFQFIFFVTWRLIKK